MRRPIVCALIALVLAGGPFPKSDAYAASGETPGSRTVSTDDIPFAAGQFDVLIDVGHGGIDGGTVHGDVLEKDLNLAVAKRLYTLLQKQGVSVALNRNTDYAPSDDNQWLGAKSRHLRDLAQRKLVIDQLKPKLTVSLHTNWARNPTKRGPSALYQTNQQSYIASHLFVSRLNALYDTHGMTYSGDTFYVLKHAKTTTVIVELGFISNTADRHMLQSKDGQKKIAEALASATRDYLLFFHMDHKSPQ